jgi:hypothetical protein
MAKKNAAPTKSEILATISKETELSKKQVGEESEKSRLVHVTRTFEDEGRKEASHEGARGCQSVQRRKNDVQSKAGEQEGAHCRIEDA